MIACRGGEVMVQEVLSAGPRLLSWFCRTKPQLSVFLACSSVRRCHILVRFDHKFCFMTFYTSVASYTRRLYQVRESLPSLFESNGKRCCLMTQTAPFPLDGRIREWLETPTVPQRIAVTTMRSDMVLYSEGENIFDFIS